MQPAKSATRWTAIDTSSGGSSLMRDIQSTPPKERVIKATNTFFEYHAGRSNVMMNDIR